MAWLSPEVTSSITLLIVSVMGAAGPFVVSWLRARQVEQEIRIKEMARLTQESKDISQGNHDLLMEAATEVKKIAQSGKGINEKLVRIASEGAATKIRQIIEHKYQLPKDELDEIETELAKMVEKK